MLKTYLLFIGILCYSIVIGQVSQSKYLPSDPSVKVGKLDNGFTYYLRTNHKPENRLELRLAVNAGSILENDDQLGLAHFVEHMAFNGSKNFEKNELISYLQSIGMDFGAEVNAYTSFDQTVYMLTIPSDSVHLVNKGFLAMEDWSQHLLFTGEEIDKERGIIYEEWRLRRGADQRMMDSLIPIIFKGSRYAERMTIGDMDIVKNCEYETLRSFYRDWYRPDMMALIVVGDMDIDSMEQKVMEHFTDFAMPENPRKRESFEIPGHKETLVKVVTDPEASRTDIDFIIKHPAKEMKTEADYLQSLRRQTVTGLLNQRLRELTEKPNPPFIYSYTRYGKLWARSCDAFMGTVVVAEDKAADGFKALVEEIERARRFGFTQGELDRYKLNLIKGYERAYNERDKTESARYTNEYIQHFLENEPFPGIEFEYEFVNNNIDKITLADINGLIREFVTDENRVIAAGGPPALSEKLNEQTLLDIVQSVASADLQPYDDGISGGALMKNVPKPGKITDSKFIHALGVTELTLSNGMKVLLKPTDFKNDEILVKAFSLGGTSVYDVGDHFSALNADVAVGEGGVGSFSKSDLRKVLAGKTVSASFNINSETENISATCRPVDIETMFQLINLEFTQPRIDPEAFEAYKSRMQDYVKNLRQNPMYFFFDQYDRIKAQNHPRGTYMPYAEDFDKVDFERAAEIYKEKVANAASFTFVIVGAFDTDSIQPFIATYLASIPNKGENENYVDLGIRPPQGYERHDILKGSDPKSFTMVYFEKEASYNDDDAFMLHAFSKLMDIRLVETIREEMSGAYTVRATTSFQRIPYSSATLEIMIPCDPNKVDTLVTAALDIVKDIQQNGVSAENVDKVKMSIMRGKEKSLKENKYWLNSLTNKTMHGDNLEDIIDTEKVNSITSESIQNVVKKYFDTNEYLQVSLFPAGDDEPEMKE